MYNFNDLNDNNRQKVDFPLSLTVDNVTLRNIEKNERILGITFNFQRIKGDTISWLTGSILPPVKDWYNETKIIEGKTITPEEQYVAAIKGFMGYVRHILVAAGVKSEDLNTISGNTIEELINNVIETANPLIDKDAKFYLKTVKNKAGYTSLPQYRRTGVALSMNLGQPTTFQYSNYEQKLIDEFQKEGV